MSYIVEVGASKVVDTLEEARTIGAAVGVVLGDFKGVRIYEPATHSYVPVVKPTFDRSKVTRNRQTAESTAIALANKINAAMGLSPDLFNRALVLDETTREWDVDYKGMVLSVKEAFPGDAEKMELFQSIVREVLAASALRGISFKV